MAFACFTLIKKNDQIKPYTKGGYLQQTTLWIKQDSIFLTKKTICQFAYHEAMWTKKSEDKCNAAVFGKVY